MNTARLGTASAVVAVVVLAACARPGAATPTTTPRPVPVVTTGPTAFAIGPGATDTWSGWLPDGRTFSAFDTTEQPISRLDPALLNAVQNAVTAAAADDVTIVITSGWRSRGFQERLFDDGIRQYGSAAAAQQFVASPEASHHVTGNAVDIGGDGASEWMIRNGPRYGLCQIYANENWHFELAVDAGGNCPPLLPNAAG